MRNSRAILAALALAAALGLPRAFAATEPIKLGEINSYSTIPAFTTPYKKGWEMAVDEINKAGGVKGRPLQVISRDDHGNPGTAIKEAQELVSSDDVVLIFGTYLSNVGLAIADFAKQKHVLFIASEPLADEITYSKGNPYTFRLRPNTTMQAKMLAQQAAKLGDKTWATVAPNYAYGKEAVAAFERELKALQPDVRFVAHQWPPLGKINGGEVVNALEQAKPDAIFNVEFGADLAVLVREGELRNLFKGRDVVSILGGEPEYLEPLGKDAPVGWIVTGYPPYAITDPAGKKFVDDYQQRYGEMPKLGSLVGYMSVLAIKAALDKAKSLKTDDLVIAMNDLSFDSPVGKVTFRSTDHQSTMGAWVGRTAVENGKPVMTGIQYENGADYMPTAEQLKTLRPQ